MPATPFDSALYSGLFTHTETAQLFSDSAEIRAMLIVEGALAHAQAQVGLIPDAAAATIHRASLDAIIDPGSLATATAANAVPVPALVAAFRAAVPDPEARPWVHFGATSQDIMDTGLALRLRRVLDLQQGALRTVVAALAKLAEHHRATPLAGRTWAVAATPTSLGAIAASWGLPLMRAVERLETLRTDLTAVSLAGAAGTAQAMRGDGAEIRAAMADALGLTDPGHATHTHRAPLIDYAAWMASTCGSLAKLGEDILSLVRLGEVTLGGGGSSSTMPQKQNPVSPSLIVALARQATALSTAMHSALPHRDQRDGSAWLVEWMSLPQLCLTLARSLSAASDLVAGLAPERAAMQRGLDPDGLSLIYAEALQFHLVRYMPRPEAQVAVKELCNEARANGVCLRRLAAARFPEAETDQAFNLDGALGDAPADADRFVAVHRAFASK